jgi:uncharacterized membrane protein YesL
MEGSVRAFRTVWQALVSFYNELILLVIISLLWWLTGGVFVGLAVFVAWVGLQTGTDAWFAPLVAIPAGPATAALASVARQAARDLRVDRSFYWDGFRSYWRRGLACMAVSMAILSVLVLNVQFYAPQPNTALKVFAIFWVYLIILALGAQLYLFPVLVGLKEPGVPATLKTTAVLALANPLYSAVLVVLALVLTVVCIALAVLLPLAWPAVIALLGEHSLMLFVERSGGNQTPDVKEDA